MHAPKHISISRYFYHTRDGGFNSEFVVRITSYLREHTRTYAQENKQTNKQTNKKNGANVPLRSAEPPQILDVISLSLFRRRILPPYLYHNDVPVRSRAKGRG